MIILLIIVNILLVKFQQRALSAFNSLYVIPIFQVTVIIVGTSLGASFFNELSGLSPTKYVLFILSILVTVSGIIIMTFAPKDKNTDSIIGIPSTRLRNHSSSNTLSIHHKTTPQLLSVISEDQVTTHKEANVANGQFITLDMNSSDKSVDAP